MKIKPFSKIIETKNWIIEFKFKGLSIKSKEKKHLYKCNSCLFADPTPNVEPCKSCIAKGRHFNK